MSNPDPNQYFGAGSALPVSPSGHRGQMRLRHGGGLFVHPDNQRYNRYPTSSRSGAMPLVYGRHSLNPNTAPFPSASYHSGQGSSSMSANDVQGSLFDNRFPTDYSTVLTTSHDVRIHDVYYLPPVAPPPPLFPVSGSAPQRGDSYSSQFDTPMTTGTTLQHGYHFLNDPPPPLHPSQPLPAMTLSLPDDIPDYASSSMPMHGRSSDLHSSDYQQIEMPANHREPIASTGSNSSTNLKTVGSPAITKAGINRRTRKDRQKRLVYCEVPGCTSEGFTEDHNLRYHMRGHEGKRPYGPCPKCGKSFMSAGDLKRHVERSKRPCG